MRSVLVSFIFFTVLCSLPLRAENEKVILVLGDSLSAAYGMKQTESWPSLLQNRLSEHGHGYRVFNSSITGDTTQGALARLPRLLRLHHPSVVIIELGGNDGLRGLPLNVTQANLQSMIQLSKDQGAKIVLAGIQLPPNYGKTYTEKFSEMYVSLSSQEGVLLVPFILEGVALRAELMQDDGIHPRAQAQPLLLDNVWAVLEPALK